MRDVDVIVMVLKELNRSVEKYGNWEDYTESQMTDVIANELIYEVGAAELAGDLHGEHGMIRELAQVSACCIKAMMVLSSRPDTNLAETVRAAGAHSEVEGRALPASPTHHQEERNPSNGPMGETA